MWNKGQHNAFYMVLFECFGISYSVYFLSFGSKERYTSVIFFLVSLIEFVMEAFPEA